MLRLALLVILVLAVLAVLRQARAPQAREPLRQPVRDPYEVLGVTRQSSPEAVRAAYQRLVSENHPDKVQSMSREIRELAERRTQEINVAYDEIKRSQRGAT